MTAPAPLPPEVQRAIVAIGHNTPGNYSLEARDGGRVHIDRLLPHGAVVAPIVDILRREEVEQAFRRYVAADTAAIAAQRKFKRARFFMLLPLMVAIAVGLFSFMTPEGQLAQWLGGGADEATIRGVKTWLVHATTWTVYAMLILTPLLAIAFRPKPAYEEWMESRGLAEGLRRRLFESVIEAPATPVQVSGAIDPWLLKLEYFRRYQLEVQDAYHDRKSAQHAGRISKVQVFRMIFVALLGIWAALMIGSALSGSTEQGAITVPALGSAISLDAAAMLQSIERLGMDTAVLGVSTALALVYAVVLYFSYLGKSARNAARFTIMGQNLDKLRSELDDVRRAAAGGDWQAVRAYVARVHSVMSVENADWVRLQALDDCSTARSAAGPLGVPGT